MILKRIAKIGLLICFLYFISVVLIIFFNNIYTVLVMEIITIISGIYMIFLIASLEMNMEYKHNIYKLLAIIFVSSCMLLTNVVHWLNIIVITPLIINGINVPEYIKIGTTPSILTTIDNLGWGLFMGLAFIFSSFYIKSIINLKYLLWINGILCLIGFFGFIINTNLWYIAPLGYGIGTLIICIKILMNKKEKK